YGDCKDKHTLLAAMLNSLGLHPSAVLIGAGVRFNDAVPSPNSFNHLITTVSVSDQQVWLDTTAEVAPYRALLYGIRDKKALVIPDTGVALVQTTPAALPFPSFQKTEALGTLDKDGISNSHLIWTMSGDEEIAVRAAFRQVSPRHSPPPPPPTSPPTPRPPAPPPPPPPTPAAPPAPPTPPS